MVGALVEMPPSHLSLMAVVVVALAVILDLVARALAQMRPRTLVQLAQVVVEVVVDHLKLQQTVVVVVLGYWAKEQMVLLEQQNNPVEEVRAAQPVLMETVEHTVAADRVVIQL
jgi:hypothetical protein